MSNATATKTNRTNSARVSDEVNVRWGKINGYRARFTRRRFARNGAERFQIMVIPANSIRLARGDIKTYAHNELSAAVSQAKEMLADAEKHWGFMRLPTEEQRAEAVRNLNATEAG